MMPHYFFQAAVALHLDGAALFISQQYTTFTTTNGVTTTVLGPSPSQVQADIDLNTPYAQPFSALLVLAGEIAEINLINSFNNNPEIQALDAKVNNSL